MAKKTYRRKRSVKRRFKRKRIYRKKGKSRMKYSDSKFVTCNAQKVMTRGIYIGGDVNY